MGQTPACPAFVHCNTPAIVSFLSLFTLRVLKQRHTPLPPVPLSTPSHLSATAGSQQCHAGSITACQRSCEEQWQGRGHGVKGPCQCQVGRMAAAVLHAACCCWRRCSKPSRLLPCQQRHVVVAIIAAACRQTGRGMGTGRRMQAQQRQPRRSTQHRHSAAGGNTNRAGAGGAPRQSACGAARALASNKLHAGTSNNRCPAPPTAICECTGPRWRRLLGCCCWLGCWLLGRCRRLLGSCRRLLLLHALEVVFVVLAVAGCRLGGQNTWSADRERRHCTRAHPCPGPFPTPAPAPAARLRLPPPAATFWTAGLLTGEVWPPARF